MPEPAEYSAGPLIRWSKGFDSAELGAACLESWVKGQACRQSTRTGALLKEICIRRNKESYPVTPNCSGISGCHRRTVVKGLGFRWAIPMRATSLTSSGAEVLVVMLLVG
jgi:hypothetical protein